MDVLDRRPPLSPLVIVVGIAVVALQLYCAGRYGIFRDEYYYLLCADHPAWGYVDHPPLAMIFLAIWKSIFGVSVISLRVPPAILNGVAALLAGLIARELRGGAAAQVLAAVAVSFMPGVLALSGVFSMNAFDVVFWALIAWVCCRLLDADGDRRWWLVLGALVGLGILNKYSVVFLSVGLTAGILFSPLRHQLFGRHGLMAALITLALVLPHFLWQVNQGWPTLEFMRNAHNLKNVALAPGEFWGEQLNMAHPGFTPVWLAGLVGLLFFPGLKTWRPLGIAFVTVGLWLTLAQAKPYYLVPAYPMVMAAGGVVIMNWLGRWRRVFRTGAWLLPVMLTVEGLLIAPVVIPVLSPGNYMDWERTLGLRPKNMENSEMGELPQHFSDRFGWQELGRTVFEVAAALPPEERPGCLIVTDNYGQCGAINYWGLPEDVQPAVSGHNSCFTWWPEEFVPEVVLAVGFTGEELQEVFTSVALGAVRHSQLARPSEREVQVWICRGWKVDPAIVRARARFAI